MTDAAVTTESVTVTTADGPMGAYVARPAGESAGAVIVIQEAFGVTGHIEDVTRRIADEGFLGIAPHFYHRTGSPVVDYSDFFGSMPHMQSLTHAGLSTDLTALVEHLGSEGVAPKSIGCVGFCLGGSVALQAAVEHPLGAAVTYYGGGHGGMLVGTLGLPPLVELAPKLQAPWLGLFGDHDEGIPVEEVEQLRAAAATASVPTEVVRYPDAGHGFNRDIGPAYHPASAADAWSRTLAWFRALLVA